MTKKARAEKLAKSQELKAESQGISGVKSWKLKTWHMKKLKAKSFIIDGKAKSQKRKFYHTAFQLWCHLKIICTWLSCTCIIFFLQTIPKPAGPQVDSINYNIDTINQNYQYYACHLLILAIKSITIITIDIVDDIYWYNWSQLPILPITNINIINYIYQYYWS